MSADVDEDGDAPDPELTLRGWDGKPGLAEGGSETRKRGATVPQPTDEDGDDDGTSAFRIIYALEVHFAAEETGWATFRELAVSSGFNARKIDLFAVGLWQSKPRALAIEVKVDRRDFQRELDDPSKRGAWDDIASEFWFATPPGLLKVDEVPDGCGLFEAGKRGVRIVKKARQRKPTAMPFVFVQALARRLQDPKPALPPGSWSLPSGTVVGAAELRKLATRLRERDAMRDRQEGARAWDREQRARERQHRVDLGAMQRVLESHFRRPVRRPEELRALLLRDGGGVSAEAVARRLRALADELHQVPAVDTLTAVE